jgi:hypothetical protein
MVTAGETALNRTDLEAVVLPHTYSRTPYTEGSEDAHGNAGETAGTAVTGLPCQYAPVERLRLDEGGRVTISQPSLLVPHDDTLAVGDRVSAIADAAGTVLLAGPLVVDSIEPSAGAGFVLLKRALLRAGDVRE